MTLRLRKKHRITARNSTPAKATNARPFPWRTVTVMVSVVAIMGSETTVLRAQQNSLREPRELPQVSTKSAHIPLQSSNSTLDPTRNSSYDNQVPRMMVRSAVFQRALSGKSNAIRLASHNESTVRSSSTLRWVDPTIPGEPLTDKPHSAWQRRGEARSAAIVSNTDPLSDPFAEQETPARQPTTAASASTGFVSPEPAYTQQKSEPAFDPFGGEAPQGSALPPLPVRQVGPSPQEPDGELPAPNVPESTEDPNPSPVAPSLQLSNPTQPRDQGSDAPAPSPELLKDDEATDLPQGEEEFYQQRMLDPTALRNCSGEQARCRLVNATSIRDISLDITPDYSLEDDAGERLEAKRERLAAAPARSWSVDGAVVAEGRLVDYTQGTVRVEQSDGAIRQIPMYRLDDADQCFVAAWWKLPLECRLSNEPAAPRHFVPMTFTWTASGICHKPLYFEQRNLERYGHAAHPLIQPALSGAHFFGSIVTLPYQMGIHPMYECQYDLGNYRVGSCAPWLLPPVPISLRAGLLQAGLVTGGTFILP